MRDAGRERYVLPDACAIGTTYVFSASSPRAGSRPGDTAPARSYADEGRSSGELVLEPGYASTGDAIAGDAARDCSPYAPPRVDGKRESGECGKLRLVADDGAEPGGELPVSLPMSGAYSAGTRGYPSRGSVSCRWVLSRGGTTRTEPPVPAPGRGDGREALASQR